MLVTDRSRSHLPLPEAVARAVAGPQRFLRLAGGLVRPGGVVAVPVGPDTEIVPPFREVRRPVPWEPGRTRRVAVTVA